MSNELLHPIESCPRCGAAFAADDDSIGCESCGAAVDGSTFVVHGWRPDCWPAWIVLPFWAVPFGLAIAGGSPDLAVAAVVLFFAHAGYLLTRKIMQRDEPREAIAVTREGIGWVCGVRSLDVLPYHLFEEVRIRPHDVAAADPSAAKRWRLTVVNAYKPSISIYLHSRGTDAPIFCSAFDLIFDAHESEAVELQSLLQERINAARAAYRATRIREIDQLAKVRRRFRRRTTCPHCAAAIAVEPEADRCWRCRSFVCYSPDRQRFVLDARPVRWNPGLGLLSIAAALVSAWSLLRGDWLAALPWLVLPAIYTAWGVWRSIQQHAGPSHQWLVTRSGLELWMADRCEQRLSWHDLPTLRYVQLERGSWRLALWTERGLRITFSPMLFAWFASPSSRPQFDAVLNDVDLAGRMICEEVAKRHARELGEGASRSVSAGAVAYHGTPAWPSLRSDHGTLRGGGGAAR